MIFTVDCLTMLYCYFLRCGDHFVCIFIHVVHDGRVLINGEVRYKLHITNNFNIISRDRAIPSCEMIAIICYRCWNCFYSITEVCAN